MPFSLADPVQKICDLPWSSLDRSGISAAAWAYYFFSIQFRENLQLAHQLRPHDPGLNRLVMEECDTDNLSPWPGVAEPGERLDHDEFMRRVLALSSVERQIRMQAEQAGSAYLNKVRVMPAWTRANSIASYEDGGLERVFRAVLSCRHWDTPLLRGFQHFLIKHIEFDSDPTKGHGSLVRHIAADEPATLLWDAFYRLFTAAIPQLADVVATP